VVGGWWGGVGGCDFSEFIVPLIFL